MHCGVYSITFMGSDGRYIGSSRQIEIRWRAHLRDLRKGKHRNQILQHAYDKYGEDNIVFTLLEELEVAQLFEREDYYLKNTSCTYNIARDAYAPTTGIRWSDERKKAFGVARRGIKFSEEARARMSAAKKGKRPSDQCLAKLREANMGHAVSEETRAKISMAHKGKKLSAEHRAKISAAGMGKHPRINYHPSPETVTKIANKNRGKKRSDEFKTKLSERSKGNRYALGNKHTEETKKRMRAAQKQRRLREKEHQEVLKLRQEGGQE